MRIRNTGGLTIVRKQIKKPPTPSRRATMVKNNLFDAIRRGNGNIIYG